ncbi:DNA alkylation repair protein [bacterium]|nr:DNA alkylation repair protein [bacterium]
MRKRIRERLQSISDPDYRTESSVTGEMLTVLGIDTPTLREEVADIEAIEELDPTLWFQYLTVVFPHHIREEILLGLYAIESHIEEFDDLFGEKISGWARELTEPEITSMMAAIAGQWVLQDMSRLGYLVAWETKGETVWKKMLGILATLQLNNGDKKHVDETIRVLSHAFPTREPEIFRCVSEALCLLPSAAITEFLSSNRVPKDKLQETYTRESIELLLKEAAQE